MAEFLAKVTEDVPFGATRVEFHEGSSKTADAWPITIVTPAAPWSYAAYLMIPPRARRVRNARLRIRTRDVRGEPWVGVLTRDQKDFVCRSAIPQGRNLRETVFDDLDLRSASMIVVQNGAQTGASRITIQSATLSIPVYGSPPPVASAAAGSKLVQLGPHRFLLRGLSENEFYFKHLHDNFEPDFQAFCQQFVDDDAVCIDIGANIGVKTLYLSRHARNGRVIAVEAAPTIAKCLIANIAANGASNVECVQTAVGDRIGSAYFAEASAYGHIASVGTEVPMTTLRDLIDRLALPSVDFIKIDVEGFEFAILKNALDVINEFGSLVLLEFNSWCQIAFADVNPKEFLAWIFDHFEYVGVLKHSADGYDLVERVGKDQMLGVLHDNLVNNRCTTDLVVTNALERI
jgi:FkbM family methyltransferase